MRVVLDQNRCVGAGQCALFAPDVFEQRLEDGIAEVLQDAPPPELYDEVETAAERCPSQAITRLTA
ncbi:ferredoxin [Streptomyces sp. SID13726]|uniref:ferredoxin n=1 Tax=Streptomyces sp. SID13726 TaxID=2706058 RepID=UPI0013BD523F|nr:ferredoxin [Streptomyces sp. SID13726]NEA99074.1 ferredoxin [Streptomyces sp. SID13726]